LKRLSILGSTGSIGKNTLKVVSRNPGKFKVVGLAAGKNIDLLESQIKEFKPEVVAVADVPSAERLRLRNLPVKILSGEDGIVEVAIIDSVDTVVAAIVGSASLLPTFEAVRAGKEIALASKEALVMAGEVIMSEASKRKVRIIPVDSEHSAIFQCLNGRDIADVRKLILTASGGAFLRKSLSELENVTPADALKHPNWDMGRKITIDSATLMNKGLEVIEARWLFDMPPEKIGVVVHPQSIIHSMVEYVDGSVLAQLSVPDMKGPIGYALSYPRRVRNVMPGLSLPKVKELTFEEPDMEKYRALSLAYEALQMGGTMPCVLNAANEAAVEAFLNEKISFAGITNVVSGTMALHGVKKGVEIEEIIKVSEWARSRAEDIIGELRIDR
jgi:1-deoxy-D-xylulose-5-phosphate reductoisomerase